MRLGRAIKNLTTLLSCAVVPLVTSAQSAAAPPRDPGPGYVPGQLIVLLEPGGRAPAPEEVVAAQRQGAPLPADLGAGTPQKVEFALSHRARGRARDVLEAAPDSPRARLERYLLITYPPDTPLDEIAETLRRNPAVESVGKNYLVDFSVPPNDPLFDDNLGDPTLHQWGSLTLDLPAAWDRAKGHANVGLIDVGLDVDHPDLRPFDAAGNYLGGNFRWHLSRDFYNPGTCESCVDEKEEGGVPCSTAEDPSGKCAGHGTHVAGIVAATSNNGVGTAGACWNCSLLMARVSSVTNVADALTWHADHGAQVVSMSFGYVDVTCNPANPPGYGVFCDAIAVANDRDLVLTASPGNDKVDIEFPASDPRVLSIGGIEPDGAFWDRADEGEGCPCDWSNRPNWLANLCQSTGPLTFECGSNYTLTPGSAQQDLVAPAKDVLSTFYVDAVWNRTLGCWDDPNHAGSGYDVCTGTSMSSPYVAGVVGVLRSANPLVAKAGIRDALTCNASRSPTWDPQFGYGVPDAAASVDDVLGRADGSVLQNRLTPLFALYSSVAEDWVYTSFPQVATGLMWDDATYFSPLINPTVGGYPDFPAPPPCQFGPCINVPRAAMYVFSTDRSPNGHPLVPLYRLSFEGTFPGGPSNPYNGDHTYTTEAAGIEAFADVGYRLDGTEGYVYQTCTPEPSCIPAGATRLYRLYNAAIDDWAIFPESELAYWQSQGYATQPGANAWIGYVYENQDADGDWLIDGFEGLIGTNPTGSDSDGDGLSDGAELLEFPYGDPLLAPTQVIGEVGQVTNLTQVDRTIVLSRSYTNPVVFAQPLSYNGGDTSVVRIIDVQSDRFTFRVEEAPDRDGPHTTETASYLVLEAGSWKLPDGVDLEVGKVSTAATVGRNVSGSWQSVSFSQAFGTAPAVFSQVQTDNDPAWVKTRQINATTSNFQVALEEEEAATTAHGSETVGWLAITPATGVWSCHRYEASTTAYAVTDVSTPVAFAKAFGVAPRFLATLASYHGGDNAALRYVSLTATGAFVKVEEDTTFDAEVGHVAEVASYFAIQGDGTLAASTR